MISYHYTNVNGVESLLLSGDVTAVVPGSHARFGQLRDYLTHTEAPDPDHVRDLLDVGTHLAATLQQQHLSDRVTFDGVCLRFDGDPIDTNLSRHIVRMLRTGDPDYKPWAAFMENLADNPSRLSRLHTFTWLNDRDFTLTAHGHLLAYKGVLADERNSSIHTGTATVNGVTYEGHIPNPLGATVEMRRSQVEENRDIGCSTGLHVGTFAYARSWGDRLLLVSVNPRDIVSVPRDSDYQKLRCCRYTVLRVYDEPNPVTTPCYHPDSTDLDEPDDLDDDLDDEPDDEPDDLDDEPDEENPVRRGIESVHGEGQ